MLREAEHNLKNLNGSTTKGADFNQDQVDFKNQAVVDLTKVVLTGDRFAPRKEAEHRINHFIRVPQVRLVGDNVEPGVYPTNEAIENGTGSGT